MAKLHLFFDKGLFFYDKTKLDSAFFRNFAASILYMILRMTLRLNDLSDLARKRVAVAAFYFVPGLVFASWASRIPDVKQFLHLNNGQLGSILLAIPMGQVLMMGFSGLLVSKLGSKKMLVLSELLYALVLFALGCSSTVSHLILSLVAFGMMANLMNIATNTQACLVEKLYGRNIMSSFHGLWSLGGFAGGIVGAVFANTVLPIEAHFGTVLALSLLILAAGFHFLVNDEQARAEEEDVPKFSFRTIDPVLFLLGLMGFAGMFCEGTVYDWSGVYFTSVVKPDEVFIRAGYVAGMGAMTLGRFLADGFVTRYGAAKVLKVLRTADSVRTASRHVVALPCYSHSGLSLGGFRHFVVCAYLLQHSGQVGHCQGEHRHHHRVEHQLLRFPHRSSSDRLACRSFWATHGY